MEEKCINGKCDLKNQTTDEVIEFMDSNEQKGFGFFVFKDEKYERKYRKDIIKNISYKKTLELGEYFGDDCVGVKFLPYGYLEDLDEVVEKMVDGPFEAQLPNNNN